MNKQSDAVEQPGEADPAPAAEAPEPLAEWEQDLGPDGPEPTAEASLADEDGLLWWRAKRAVFDHGQVVAQGGLYQATATDPRVLAGLGVRANGPEAPPEVADAFA